MRTMYLLLLTISLLVTGFVACDKANKFKAPADQAAKYEEQKQTSDVTLLAADSTDQGVAEENRKVPRNKKAESNPDWDKNIIKTADINLEVKDYKSYNNSLRQVVKSFGGYIGKEEQNQSDYKLENTVTIKVPVDQFDDAVNKLAATEKVWEKKINTDDVTGEVVDIKSRMEAKKQVRLRYLEFLKQAKNISEVLEVQNEINDIQEEIESSTGRVNYLTRASAMSTIQLTFFQVLNASAKDNEQPTFATKTIEAIKSGAWWLGQLFIILVSLWPVCLAVVVGWIIFRKRSASKIRSISKSN